MSEHAVAPPAGETRRASFFARHHFLLRRLHSLSGIVPVGLFVIAHLFTNFQILVGDFQHEVEWIHSGPALPFIEVSLWLGIGFHAALGLVYTFGDNFKLGLPESTRYQWQDSWRYTLQRVTGIIALVFIFLHIATLRWRWDFYGWFEPFFVAGPDGHPLVAATTANAIQHSWPVLVIYVVGVAAVIYHWCNGLWTAAISWGLTVSVGAMRRWGYVCATLGVLLTIFSAGAIWGSLTYKLTDRDLASIREAKSAYRAGQQLPERATGESIPAAEGPAERQAPRVGGGDDEMSDDPRAPGRPRLRGPR